MKTITLRTLFLTAIFVISGQLISHAMVTDSILGKGPNPKKGSNEVKPVKIAIPSAPSFAQADLEIVINMEKDMNSLYSLLIWKRHVEEGDKIIHDAFYAPYTVGLKQTFQASDNCMHECFLKDIL